MRTYEAVQRLTAILRRKHLALSTEQSYCAWLKRYCDHVRTLPAGLPSEQKLERFLTTLARQGVAASTQNQAFNAVLFFYKEALGVELKNIHALRARRPSQVRHAPSREETLLLLQTVQAEADFATHLAVRLLYGCGLRVTEPLGLRIKDVDLESAQLIIRAAKGGKDRVVAIPCSALEDVRQQVESARVVWKRDQLGQVPVALPHQLAVKYPRAQFDWKWAWVFPAHQPCLDPRSGKVVRWRFHEANLQRASGLFLISASLPSVAAPASRQRWAE